MFKVLYWTPFTAGFVDGVNPCFLMTFALMILAMLWFKRVGISRAWMFLFIGMMIFNTFAFNCGFMDRFVLSDLFQLFSRVVYVVLAVFVGMKGIKFLREWHSLSKGQEIKAIVISQNKWSPFAIIVVLGLVALLLSMMATLWPINSYIMTFTVYMMMPGQFIILGSLVFLYTLISFWFVAAGMTIFLIEAKNQRLFKIVAAAILLSASLGILDIIFTKG
jgi:hypothetical protein